MKITKVYTEQYRWPKAKPIANGKHVYTHNDLNLLVIETDEGITGYGCSWAIEFAESMGRAILGEDPLNNERLWQKTYVPKFIGRRGTSAKTVSANRMDWINVWRENISTFIANATILHERGYVAKRTDVECPCKEPCKDCCAECLKIEAEMLKARELITTRLNMAERKHVLLFAAIKQFDYSAENTKFAAQCEYIEELARQILKPEWERVKDEARGKEKN